MTRSTKEYCSPTEEVNDSIDQDVEEKQSVAFDILRVTPEQIILDNVEDYKRDKVYPDLVIYIGNCLSVTHG